MYLQLRYFSIAHQQANATVRQLFSLSEEEQQLLYKQLTEVYPDLLSMLILTTCNRVEVYFEASETTASQLRDYFIQFKGLAHQRDIYKRYFRLSDQTLKTSHHLMRVANGLESRIMGDAQIIRQVKLAYQQALKRGLQGKLLERSMQVAFRLHKRISNETSFRSGTLSFAYLSLKSIAAFFGREYLPQKKLLILGAGDISGEVAKYSAKFSFKEVAITNRTAARAALLAGQYQLHTYSWQLAEENSFGDFDAIISCVSNRQGLLKAKSFDKCTKPMILLDLAMPQNIEKPLVSNPKLCIQDLDNLLAIKTGHAQQRKEAQQDAERLLQDELASFSQWLSKSKFGNALCLPH
jgi:glutamyl-tRNA reductase